MSIALLIPLITLFLNDDLNKIPFISKYFELANYNYQELIKIILTFIFFLYLFKSVYLSFSEYYIQKIFTTDKNRTHIKDF